MMIVMNKALAGLLVLGLSSTASADKVGAYLFGVQYTQQQSGGNALRYGLGVPAVSVFRGNGAVSVSGDVSYLMPLSSLTSTGTSAGTNVYVGAGLGLGATIGRVGGVAYTNLAVVPAALLGVEFDLNRDFSVFVEGSLGYGISVGASTAGASVGAGFQPGLRLGVNYNLR